MILEHLVDELVDLLNVNGGLDIKDENDSSLLTIKSGKMKNPPPSSPFNELAGYKSSKMDPEYNELDSRELLIANVMINTSSKLSGQNQLKL